MKNANRVAIFCHAPLPNILKYWGHKGDLSKVWKTGHLQTCIEEFS